MPIYAPYNAAIDGRPTTGVSSGVGGAGVGSSPPPTPNPAFQDFSRTVANQQATTAQQAMQKTYRPEYGIALTDAEYAQRKQTERSNQVVNDTTAQQRATEAARSASTQQASQANTAQQQSYGNAAAAGLGAAGPVTSNYTGQPTSPLDADRAKMQLEAEFAQRNAVNAAGVQSQSLKDSAALQAEAEARRLGYMPQIMASMPGMVTHGSGAGGQQEEAARAAAFARAKEQAGSTALSSLRGLEDYSAGRGQTGSSMERSMIGDVVGGAAGQVNEFTRDQLIADLQRAAQLSDQEYQGNITQRGQNMALTPAMLGLVGQRAAY